MQKGWYSVSKIRRIHVIMFLLSCIASEVATEHKINEYVTLSKKGRCCFPRKPTPKENLLGGLWRDIVDLNKYALFSADTFKVIATTFPLYVSTRMFDEDLQKAFHRTCCHKDINQAPHWCYVLSKYGLGIPMATLGLMAFVSKSAEFRITGRIFLIGMPFVLSGKDIIKKIPFEANKRPWCDKFPCSDRAYGGFPSGHMAEISYMTVLYGLRYGLKAAAPIGIFGTFLGVTFLNCNRHYLSQLIAGVGLGTLFALAADKVIDKRLAQTYNEHFTCGYDTDGRGQPAFKVAYMF